MLSGRGRFWFHAVSLGTVFSKVQVIKMRTLAPVGPRRRWKKDKRLCYSNDRWEDAGCTRAVDDQQEGAARSRRGGM